MAKSKSAFKSFKKIRKGLAIFKNGHSKFWTLRLWDPLAKRYVQRTTKETVQLEALGVAVEFADNYKSGGHPLHAAKKSTSFEHYAKQLIQMQALKGGKWSGGDAKLLNRSEDGLIAYFGKWDVSKINTGAVRDYLLKLDTNRGKPLAESTKAKHTIIMRKVLAIAVEDGVLNVLPVMPKQKTVDTPRLAFTDSEYKKFIRSARECAKRGDVVRGVKVREHHARMFTFIVHSFLRPTESELFGLKHKDVQVKGQPPHLEMKIDGKTGKRTSVTMPIAVPLYQGMLNPFDESGPDKNAYVWMPEYPNRTTAINTARRIFNHILENAGLTDEDQKFSPYSLRHYSLQARLRGSKGKVNIHTLATNAGTSVDQLERFYLKKMAPSKELIENLQTNGD
ncbi:site-specific integrase [Leisingera sp. JC11]|uniref:site-specific integrase n=1 Tax=Leisingera sp. JC11 TaxID=3042469 RepID=UPI0034554C5F